MHMSDAFIQSDLQKKKKSFVMYNAAMPGLFDN